MGKPSNPSSRQPSAASGAADAESGSEGLDPDKDVEKDLFALNVMRERRLIDKDTFAARYRALTGKDPEEI